MVRRQVHGLSHTTEYTIWKNIKARCYLPTHRGFPMYGGRGIKLHSIWYSNPYLFIYYIKALPNYTMDNVTLDRVHNDYGYEPLNLRWATKEMQVANSSRRIDSIQVDQYTLDNIYVATHSSITEASKVVKGYTGCIRECLKGTRKTHKKFKWIKH